MENPTNRRNQKRGGAAYAEKKLSTLRPRRLCVSISLSVITGVHRSRINTGGCQPQSGKSPWRTRFVAYGRYSAQRATHHCRCASATGHRAVLARSAQRATHADSRRRPISQSTRNCGRSYCQALWKTLRNSFATIEFNLASYAICGDKFAVRLPRFVATCLGDIGKNCRGTPKVILRRFVTQV